MFNINKYKPQPLATGPVRRNKAIPSDKSVQDRLREYKRMRMTASSTAADALEDYSNTDFIPDPKDSDSKGPHFDVLQYWFDRRHMQPELARVFLAGRDLIDYWRSQLEADIIEACPFLPSSYGPPAAKTIDGKVYAAFDDEEVIEKQYEKLYTQKGLQTDDIEE